MPIPTIMASWRVAAHEASSLVPMAAETVRFWLWER